MTLFSHWLFWLKNLRFSTVVRVYYILNLMIPVIATYESFKTELLKISYFLQYSLMLIYFMELSGPRGKCSVNIRFWHGNLNNLPAHNYAKVHLLQAFNTLHRFEYNQSLKNISWFFNFNWGEVSYYWWL